MRKYLIIFLTLLTCVFLVVFDSFLNKESNLIENFQKDNNSQTLFELTEYYKKEEDYLRFVEYSELLLFDALYSFDEIDLKNTGYENDILGMYDSYMQEYLVACSYAYTGDEYIEKIIKGYKKCNNYGYAISGVVDSIQEYYTLKSDVDVCIKAYNKLIESASHIVTQRLLVSNKYDFVSVNCDNEELIKETEILLKEYVDKVSTHMKEEKKNGVSVEEYNNSIKP